MFQLCNEYDKTNTPKDYLIEVKYDGTLVTVANGRVINRYGLDITKQFPELKIDNENTKVVGELCIFEGGKSIFNSILRRKTINNFKISMLSKIMKATLVIFDVLNFEGKDISKLPLRERRNYLTMVKGENIMLPEVITGTPEEAFKVAEKRGIEGIIIKDLNASYEDSRNNNFLKYKCFKEDRFNILSYEKSEKGFTALLENNIRVGVNNNDYRSQIESGRVKTMLVQYLEKTDNGMLRLPSCKGVL